MGLSWPALGVASRGPEDVYAAVKLCVVPAALIFRLIVHLSGVRQRSRALRSPPITGSVRHSHQRGHPSQPGCPDQDRLLHETPHQTITITHGEPFLTGRFTYAVPDGPHGYHAEP
jgi:hypothetical protein